MRPEPRTLPGLAEALPELRATLAVDGSPRNAVRVAEAHWWAGRPDVAIEILAPLVERGTGGVAARLLLGWCHEDAGHPAEAEAAIAEARRLEPANPYVGEDPVEADERAAEPERSLSVEELAEVPPGPLYSATLAEIFERQGFEEKALEIYREVVRLHPERDDLRARIDDLVRREEEEGFGE
jgi:tetratricopeptide (TPR) repeat protein